MQQIDLSIPKGAIFSDCGKYRYSLWRIWQPRKPLLMFIGLNPSTAGALNDDPTITRVTARAAKNDFGGILAANLYALVSTDPGLLLTDPEPIGVETDYFLEQMIRLSKFQLCAWGAFAAAIVRAPKVYSMATNPICLGITKSGEPEHPLYISYDRKFIIYERGI